MFRVMQGGRQTHIYIFLVNFVGLFDAGGQSQNMDCSSLFYACMVSTV